MKWEWVIIEALETLLDMDTLLKGPEVIFKKREKSHMRFVCLFVCCILLRNFWPFRNCQETKILKK